MGRYGSLPTDLSSIGLWAVLGLLWGRYVFVMGSLWVCAHRSVLHRVLGCYGLLWAVMGSLWVRYGFVMGRYGSVPTDLYSIGFLPLENGVHAVEVRLNGRHVPGSPFNVRVGEQSHDADPALVTAYGAGLLGGVTGMGGGGNGAGGAGGDVMEGCGWGERGV